ncbi:MAG: transcriptional repressor LexA [Candidatus Muiribacteriota bacterium]
MITKKQKNIYDYIINHIENHDYSPTLKELCDYFGLKSVATMYEHINKLVNEGLLIKRDNGKIDIPKKNQSSNDTIEIPLYGYVTAGLPIDSEVDENEKIEIPSFMNRRKSYALKVKGNSMIDEHIMDGDIVVVENLEQAWNGQTVVALIDNEEVTLKKFYREESGKIRLQPANSNFEPIILDPEQVKIQGIVVGVIRMY